MKAYVQVLTTPTADTPGTTFLLHFDNKRYLFGSLGEGTQRAMNQMGARLLKTQEIFITGRSEWRNTGGLMGMMLTLSDVLAASNVDKQERGLDATPKILSMFGPPNLNHTIAACRRFIFRKGMPINAVDIKDEEVKKDENGTPVPLFVDSNTNVWAMSITPTDAERPERPSAASKSRKRSYDEVNGPEPAADTPKETPEETAARHEQLTRSVVNDMFNSNWRLDALHQKPLSEVKLPATVFRRNSLTKAIEKYNGPIPNPTNPDLQVLVREPWPAVKVSALPPTKPAPQAVSYIIRNHPQTGKFDVRNAIKHDVPKGKLWSKLQAGEPVQNVRGETITPDMILDPPRRGRGVAIVDLPTSSYVEPLIQREEWTHGEIMDGVGAFLWILGPGVAANPALKKFMADRAHLEHIVSSVDVLPNRISFDSVSGATLRLGRVDEKRYGAPHYDDDVLPQERFVAYKSQKEELPEFATPAERGLKLSLEPQFELQKTSALPRFDPKTSAEVPEEVLAIAKTVKESVESSSEQFDQWRRKIPLPEAEIIALGTGSALPSKYRNVSATLVRVPGYGSYLLDAGENTLGQLQRVFKPAELAEILKELRVIWLSHMHADHILGIVSVIKAWYEVVHGCQPTSETAFEAMAAIKNDPSLASEKKRLAVIADLNMVNWLAEYAAVEDYGYSRLFPLAAGSKNPWAKPDELNELPMLRLQAPPPLAPEAELIAPVPIPRALYPQLLGLQDLEAVHVVHCYGARAVSLTWPDATRLDPADPASKPFKVSYSGDCRPCPNFARIGRHSTVLIHEATFEDGLEGNAVAKKHSTTSEALAIGARMRARMTLLTHFSQRYQKLPVVEREQPAAENGDDNAVDKMDIDDNDGVVDDVDAIREEDEEEDEALLQQQQQQMQQQQQQQQQQAVEPDENEPLDDPDGPPKPIAPELLKTEDSGEPLATRIRSRSDMRVGVASDYMRVKVGEFAELERYVPALQALLAEEEKLEEKGVEGGGGDEVAAEAGDEARGGGGGGDGGGGAKGKNKEKKEKRKKEKKQKEKEEKKQKEKEEKEQKEKEEKKEKGDGQQQQQGE
ncbi:ribonuclease z [Diplodia corticola]|uniref:ribonuclease Z n=1 Tax=Diplodia corticola TaxID=236234 RepID=A0A1J9RT67_9PEZI|nr:ribonuclease z [Diplodia corticola]OJD30725.1 ribonuclease z [Diplodia corticola]